MKNAISFFIKLNYNLKLDYNCYMGIFYYK